MDHNEAKKQMAVERYLLNELTPELRDSFEEHFFDCPECSTDLRAGAAFISVAKAELPKLAEPSASPSRSVIAKKKPNWFAWLRPAFAVPAIAALLGVVAYQNISTIPALHSAVNAPRVLPSTAFHAGTRGAAHTLVQADRTQGVVLSIDLPQESTYASYAFDLYDPQGKHLWTRETVSSNVSDGENTVSLVIPGEDLEQGSYTLAISGVTAQGGRTEIDRRTLDIHF